MSIEVGFVIAVALLSAAALDAKWHLTAALCLDCVQITRVQQQRKTMEAMYRIHKATVENRYFLDTELSCDELARKLNMSAEDVLRVIKSAMGVNFDQFITQLRVEYAKDCLKHNPALSPIDIALASGFKSPSAFCRHFINVTRMTPAEFKLAMS